MADFVLITFKKCIFLKEIFVQFIPEGLVDSKSALIYMECQVLNLLSYQMWLN